MPLAKIHFHEGSFDEKRMAAISEAIHGAFQKVLKTSADDFFQVFCALPKGRFMHTPAFLGISYTHEFILLEVTFIVGRSAETRLELQRELNRQLVELASIRPEDLMVMMYEVAGENISFGHGEAQRARVAIS